MSQDRNTRQKKAKDTDAVLWGQLNTALDTQTETLNSSIAAAIESLTLVINSNKEDLFNKIDSVKEELSTSIQLNTADIKKNEGKISEIELATMVNSVSLNDREQRDRAPTIKVHFFNQFASAENHTLLIGVYNTLFKPALQIACDVGKIDSVPSFWQTIENGHRLKKHKNSNPQIPAPILMKIRTRLIKELIMSNVKSVIADLASKVPDADRSYVDAAASAGPANLGKLRCGNDLTMTNRLLMNKLYKDDRVEAVRLGSTRVQFLKVDETTWRQVNNPFASTLEGLESELTNKFLL